MKFDIKNINLEIKNYKNFSNDLKKKINQSGILDIIDKSKVESWTAIGTNKELAYSSHGMMRFFGKFPPPIARYLITNFVEKKEIVLDPMGGSGTTAVESLLLDKYCHTYDLNPLMVLLQKAKITKVSVKEINKYKSWIIKNYKPKDYKHLAYIEPTLKNVDHWFLKETLDSIFGIRDLIEKIKSEKIRNFFLVSLLSIVRRVSKATTQQGRLFLDVETAQKNALPFFLKKVESNKDSISKLRINKKIVVKRENAFDLSKNKNKFKLIILHPPYFNSYKYSSVNSLESFVLGSNIADFRKQEVREFFKIGKAENHNKYVEDMVNIINFSYKILKKNGHLAVMFGDAFIKGEYIQIIKKTLEKVNITKKNLHKIAIRVPKFTESSWVSSQRRKGNSVGINLFDYVVMIKKK